MKEKSLKDWIYVLIQVVFFILYLQNYQFIDWEVSSDFKILFQLVSGMGFLWALLAIMSMNTLVSPFPSPKEGMQLQTDGVYKFCRHPIYSGILLLLYAWGVANASEYKIAIGLGFHVFIYLKATYEEQLLQLKFPQYQVYKNKTGMFFPKLFHFQKE